jgi:glycosyltransferase involved in cell wall biosynthesis
LKKQQKTKVIVSVSNDLITDQRVLKVCDSLHENNFDVLLVGRLKKNSPTLPPLAFQTKRLHLIFERGFLFYAEFNIRLFFFLLFHSADILHSNDLDTLLPNFLVAKLKRKKLVYDTHEYFTEVPEIQKRPLVKKVWSLIEKSIFPNLKYVFTVNDSIADLYFKKYGIRPAVMRNVPKANNLVFDKTKKELQIPENKTILILQGNGININRGAEEAVLAMQWIDDAMLYLIGSGDVIPIIEKIIQERNLENKVILLPRMPYREMMQYTHNADIGLTLDKDSNINYQFSLPNKVFDYLRAGIAIISSDLIELRKVIESTASGVLLDKVSPECIAQEVNKLISSPEKLKELKANAQLHANKYAWEEEVKALLEVYRNIKK